MANIVAYCRVSTDKEDQLNSLEAQKRFFKEYATKNGDNLVRVYADEGISGTKTKNRKEFAKLMFDAKQGLFEKVITKDISRLARNTVDFLNSIRQLKALGIETEFLTTSMSVLGTSELVLTMFAALAQEESANTSKRVKFGKKINAEKGRVPNVVFGYDKIKGDYFNLLINEEEAEVVKMIFKMYTENGDGGARIARKLNAENIKTKRNGKWTQVSVCGILRNELYIGRVINGKEEVKDFLTGERLRKDESEWHVTERPEFRVIDDETFEKAQKILKGRYDSFKITGERHSNKHIFSTLIKCEECGRTFRRTVRTYKNTYVRWVCTGRNVEGVSHCSNKVTVDEGELVEVIQNYFISILNEKPNVIMNLVKEFKRVYKTKDENEGYEKDLNIKFNKLQKTREKLMDMYTDDLISREELKTKMSGLNGELEKIQGELKLVEYNINKGDQLEEILYNTFSTIDDIVSMETMSNTQLKQVIEKIEVDTEGNVRVQLKSILGMGLDEPVRIVSTVHKDLAERLPSVDAELAKEVKNILDYHKSIRHLRGGEATKQKYLATAEVARI